MRKKPTQIVASWAVLLAILGLSGTIPRASQARPAAIAIDPVVQKQIAEPIANRDVIEGIHQGAIAAEIIDRNEIAIAISINLKAVEIAIAPANNDTIPLIHG